MELEQEVQKLKEENQELRKKQVRDPSFSHTHLRITTFICGYM